MKSGISVKHGVANENAGLFLALLLSLPRLIYIITSCSGFSAFLKQLRAWLYQLPSYLVLWALVGAGTGLAIGLSVWLLADFRRRKGAAGRIFVGLLVAMMLLIFLLPYALSLSRSFTGAD